MVHHFTLLAVLAPLTVKTNILWVLDSVGFCVHCHERSRYVTDPHISLLIERLFASKEK
jgi:hypothetical protein